jgi:hypothetical protein
MCSNFATLLKKESRKTDLQATRKKAAELVAGPILSSNLRSLPDLFECSIGCETKPTDLSRGAHVDERWLKEHGSLGLTSELWNEFVG